MSAFKHYIMGKSSNFQIPELKNIKFLNLLDVYKDEKFCV